MFDKCDESFSYMDIYVYCTSIQLDLAEDVNVTTSFCNDCVENLISFSNFKVCSNVQHILADSQSFPSRKFVSSLKI